MFIVVGSAYISIRSNLCIAYIKNKQTAKELYPMRFAVLCAAMVGDCKIVGEYRCGLLYSILVECYVCPVFGSPIPNTPQIYALFSNRQNIFGEILQFKLIFIVSGTQRARPRVNITLLMI